MPKERKKVLCMDAQRHAEYYGMQRTFDELYAKSKAGETFTGLMELVLSPDNIMLAYRNIKTNTGSYTAGTDKQNIGDIGRLPLAEVIGKVKKIVTGSEHGYRPKPVRRKDIPKPNGKTRPLGIPCIWDRLVQQCIKQILEPICEAKFSNNSYGFRPNRSVEHAISRTYSLLQRAHLHYVLEIDIKGFFDNVNHSKLIQAALDAGHPGQATPVCHQAHPESPHPYAGWQHRVPDKRNTPGRDYLPAVGQCGAQRAGSLDRQPVGGTPPGKPLRNTAHHPYL